MNDVGYLQGLKYGMSFLGFMTPILIIAFTVLLTGYIAGEIQRRKR